MSVLSATWWNRRNSQGDNTQSGFPRIPGQVSAEKLSSAIPQTVTTQAVTTQAGAPQAGALQEQVAPPAGPTLRAARA